MSAAIDDAEPRLAFFWAEYTAQERELAADMCSVLAASGHLTTTTSCGARAPAVDPGPTQPSAIAPTTAPAAVEDPAGGRAGGGLPSVVAKLRHVVDRLDFSGGDYISISDSVAICAAEDEVVVMTLVTLGGSPEPRLEYDAGIGSFFSTLVHLDGVDVRVSTPVRRDPLVDQLAATAERVAAGETLAEVRANPLRSVP